MAEKKKKKIIKKPKKKWDFPIGLTKMTEEEADLEMRRFFDAFEKNYKDIPDAEIERGAKKIENYLNGKIGWAELFNFTPDMLFEMAEFGFAQFKVGRYEDAERVFKVLTVLDWDNAYYHSVMGSILQKQKRFGESIAEYSQAIELDDEDIPSYTNRGEILFSHGMLDEAEKDLAKAIELDPDESDRFANRARILMEQLAAQREKEGQKES